MKSVHNIVTRGVLAVILLSAVSVVSAAERIAPELKKLIERGDDTRGDAVVLHQQQSWRLEPEGDIHRTLYRAVRLNTRDAARDFSQISIGYNSYFDQVSVDFARVLTSDGQILELDEDAWQIQTASNSDFYQDGRFLAFSLPAVSKGSVIEYQLSFESVRQKMPGELSDSGYFHYPVSSKSEKRLRIDPVVQSVTSVSIPSSKSLKFSDPQGRVKFSRSTGNGQIRYTWQYSSLNGIEVEQGMPELSDIIPYLEFSTIDKWAVVDRWASGLIDDKLIPDQKIESIAHSIAARYSNRNDRILAVYRYVQENIRYVFAHVDRGGYEPHSAAQVLSSQYGDCKDQTVLTVALLRALDIEAYPALIATDNADLAKRDLPSLPFDHMISYIPAAGGETEIWMDTTGEQALYPGFSGMIEDRNALVINGSGGIFLTTPKHSMSQNSVVVDVRFAPLKAGKPNGQISFSFGGLFEDSYRSWWIHTDDQRAAITELVTGLYPKLKVTGYSATSALNLTEPFALKADFVIDENWQDEPQYSYSAGIIQLAKLFSGMTELPLPDNRVNSFAIYKATSLTMNVRIDTPEKGAEPVLLNQGLDKKTSWFELTQKSEREGDSYSISIALDRPAMTLTPDQYKVFYGDAERMLSEKPWIIRYDIDRSEAKQTASSTVAKQYADSSLEEIKKQLDKGDFDAARDQAEQYTKSHPKSGEGFYLLGLAQGYLDLFSESDESFSKARQLGYSF